MWIKRNSIMDVLIIYKTLKKGKNSIHALSKIMIFHDIDITHDISTPHIPQEQLEHNTQNVFFSFHFI